MEDAAPTAARLRPAAGEDRSPGDVVLGRYALVRILGRGGAGTVWMAEDQNLGRLVALKCLPQEGDRALGEARAAARLGHPTVVTTYGIASADGCTWLITEFVAGDTLRRTIRDDTHTDDELLQIGVALCVGLRHAHDHGIVHRDVTPRNVLVPVDAFSREEDGGVSCCHPHVPPAKLADFGIARPKELHEETRKGRIVGTLSYMAPERLEGAQGDEQGDLWALGVILHEAFVGEHPAGRPELAGALVRAHKDVPSLAPRRPDLPAGVVAAIDRAVAEEPAERGSVLDLERALRAGLGHRGVPLSPVLREQSTRDSVALPAVEPPAPRTPLGRAVPGVAAVAALTGPAFAAACALALVAAALTALWTAGSSDDARPGSRRLAAGLLLLALAAAAGGLVVAPLVGAVVGGASIVVAPALAAGLVVLAGGCPGLPRAPRSIR
jgi:serine/threonine-protein kinase